MNWDYLKRFECDHKWDVTVHHSYGGYSEGSASCSVCGAQGIYSGSKTYGPPYWSESVRITRPGRFA